MTFVFTIPEKLLADIRQIAVEDTVFVGNISAAMRQACRDFVERRQRLPARGTPVQKDGEIGND